MTPFWLKGICLNSTLNQSFTMVVHAVLGSAPVCVRVSPQSFSQS
jgi:hypothetical protein